ncbi:Very-long-chain 3-oxoacyl-CoA reductase [Porphyridium purpureum]|uniref:Very-long-chain 3-oxoacyl-CoA reductase n=1 Tax=Porphyridium purpureum TaxID=35688 RepID=A0A5J4Z696_PORPP|nr:Very-long-chain 3-oxoacyl-CoA reductase [Porphyridium purpureum]|eukprot:POR4943..scf295_1
MKELNAGSDGAGRGRRCVCVCVCVCLCEASREHESAKMADPAMLNKVIVAYVLLGLGAVALARVLGGLAGWLLRYFLRPNAAPASYAAFRGEWAVVTGASQGVGEGFVRELAKRKMNVVLLARSEEKLKTLAADVERQNTGIKTKVIRFDFDSATAKDYAALEASLKDLNVSVLVNNVGVNVPFPTDFVDVEPEAEDRIVRVNITSTNKMTRMLLPAMIANKKGAIYMMSSAAGTVSPAPMLSIYGATKAYMDSLAISLSGEVARYNVSVQSCIPFYVVSEMSKFRKSSFTVPSATFYAKLCLDARGSDVQLNAYWPHDAMANALRLLPLKSQVSYVNDLHGKIRARALKKKEREQKAQ